MSNIDWFLAAYESYKAGQDTLPKPPFRLNDWIEVTEDGFYQQLENECKAQLAHISGQRDKPSPRFRYGEPLDLVLLAQNKSALSGPKGQEEGVGSDRRETVIQLNQAPKQTKKRRAIA